MGDTDIDIDMGEDTGLKAKQKHWVRGMFKRFTVTSCARGGGGANNSLIREKMEEKEVLVVEPDHSDNNSINASNRDTLGGGENNKRRSNARSRDVEHVKFATKETPISERRSNARGSESDQHCIIVKPKEAQGMESRRNSNLQTTDINVDKVNVASKEAQVVESKRLPNVYSKDTDQTKVAPQTPRSGGDKEEDPVNCETKKEDVITQIPKSEDIKKGGDSGSNDNAAITIQAFFRGHLARRACRALRSLVKLQAHVRGMYVRKQSEAATTCMKSLVRLQIRVRERQMLLDKQQQEA